jgi:hypothetical protein
MELPAFVEIHLESFEVNKLVELFKVHKLGKVPVILTMENTKKNLKLNNLDNAENKITDEEWDHLIHQRIINILSAIKILKVHPHYPFPVYLVSDVKLDFRQIGVFPNINDLPRYFFCKNRKVTKREQTLLKKITIVKEKMEHGNFELAEEKMLQQSVKHKTLFRLVREADFYEKILNQNNQTPVQKLT